MESVHTHVTNTSSENHGLETDQNTNDSGHHQLDSFSHPTENDNEAVDQDMPPSLPVIIWKREEKEESQEDFSTKVPVDPSTSTNVQ